MVRNVTFYDFRILWSVSINIMYKLHLLYLLV